MVVETAKLIFQFCTSGFFTDIPNNRKVTSHWLASGEKWETLKSTWDLHALQHLHLRRSKHLKYLRCDWRAFNPFMLVTFVYYIEYLVRYKEIHRHVYRGLNQATVSIRCELCAIGIRCTEFWNQHQEIIWGRLVITPTASLSVREFQLLDPDMRLCARCLRPNTSCLWWQHKRNMFVQRRWWISISAHCL